MIGCLSQTKAILDQYGLMAKKKYGQNFLIEPTIIHKVQDKIQQEDIIIEIGAGLGALTEAMAQRAKKVIAYEIDDDLIEVLHENLKDYDNVEIIHKDFLTVDMDELLAQFDKVSFVSNLPYYITTELLTVIFSRYEKIDKVIAMMQKEVADRFLKDEKGKDYNVLQVIAKYHSDIQLLTKVNKNNFFPSPKVDSAILIYTIREYKNKVENEKRLFDIVKAAFSQRRKMVLGNLNKCGFELTKEQLEEIGVLSTARVEQLDLDDYIKIYEVISND